MALPRGSVTVRGMPEALKVEVVLAASGVMVAVGLPAASYWYWEILPRGDVADFICPDGV